MRIPRRSRRVPRNALPARRLGAQAVVLVRAAGLAVDLRAVGHGVVVVGAGPGRGPAIGEGRRVGLLPVVGCISEGVSVLAPDVGCGAVGVVSDDYGRHRSFLSRGASRRRRLHNDSLTMRGRCGVQERPGPACSVRS